MTTTWKRAGLHACLVGVILTSAVVHPARVAGRDRPELAAGAVYELFEMGQALSRVPLLEEGELPNVSEVRSSLDLDDERGDFGDHQEQFYLRVWGYLGIRKSGTYQFRLKSDDGSKLTVADALVVDNDGAHAAVMVEGKIALRAGPQPFLLEFFENGGKAMVQLEWRPPGAGKFTAVPASALAHPAAHEHKTAPGTKKMRRVRKNLDGVPRSKALEWAIGDGIDFLMGEIENKQEGVTGKNQVGQVALETYALVVAGVSVDHRLIRANFDYLKKRIPEDKNTYAVSCYVFALDAAIAQLEYDALILAPPKTQEKFRDHPGIGRDYRKQLKSAIDLVLEGQNATGGWRYQPSAQDADVSCTQFSALALGVAAKRRIRVNPEVWQRLWEYFAELQDAEGPETSQRVTRNAQDEEHRDGVTVLGEKGGNENGQEDRRGRKKDRGRTKVPVPTEPLYPEVGTEALEVRSRGWRYTADRGADWNMSCAGLSSAVIIRGQIGARYSPDERQKLNAAIRDGFGWLMENWSATSSYYGIYSLEKVADLSGVKLFGDRDWYEVVSDYLLGEQDQNGSWPPGGSHGENARVSTSFALLVLNRATSLLTMNPARRVVVTGVEQKPSIEDREWVYVRDLDTYIHYPELVRTIRLRPNPKLVRFLDRICEAYPAAYTPELMPGLLQVRRAVTSKAVAKRVNNNLRDIAGKSLDSDEAYLKWKDVWQNVLEVGQAENTGKVAELIDVYREAGKSLAMRLTVIRSLQFCKGGGEARSLLVQDLGHSNLDVRVRSYDALASFYRGQIPLFDPTAKSDVRRAQVAEIQAWSERL